MLRYKSGDQIITFNLYNFVVSVPDNLEEVFNTRESKAVLAVNLFMN